MRCGYHCTKMDYLNIKTKTDAFLKLLQKDDPLFFEYGMKLVDEMKDYDFELANKFLLVLNKDISHQEMYEREGRLIRELMQNIMVDMMEHN